MGAVAIAIALWVLIGVGVGWATGRLEPTTQNYERAAEGAKQGSGGVLDTVVDAIPTCIGLIC